LAKEVLRINIQYAIIIIHPPYGDAKLTRLKGAKMVNTLMGSIFTDPFFIGFNREMERMAHVHQAATRQTYPPYDVLKLDEDTFQVSIAVAGFSKSELDVSVDNGTLIVKGETKDAEAEGEFLHRGIASRKFTRTFGLGEYMEVTGASIEDGMLTINVDRIIPEEKKPKVIKIK
jgi:molecular chaperone IbpA